MTEVLVRASALRQLVRESNVRLLRPSVAESVIACSEELSLAGEASVALELLSSIAERLDESDFDTATRFSLAKARALHKNGQYRESLELLRNVLNADAARLRALEGEVYSLRILEASNLWRLDRVEEAVERLQAIRRELLARPDSCHLAVCAWQLQAVSILRGDHEQARRFGLEAIVSARRTGSMHIEACAHDNMARLERYQCRWPAAVESGELAVAGLRALGCRCEANNSLRSLAITLWKRGRCDEAMLKARECLEEARGIGHATLERYAGLLVGMIHVSRGEWRLVEPYLGDSVHLQCMVSDARAELLRIELMGDSYLEQGKAERALEYFDQVWPQALALVPKGDIVAELRRRRAECYYLLGRHDEAYAEAKTGLEHCRELGDRYEEAATYRVLALSAAAVGKPSEAKQWFDQGFAYYDDIETPYEWGKLWMAYGDWLTGPHAAEYADQRGAFEAYYAARDHFERMGAAAKLAEAEARLAKLRESLAPVQAAAPADSAAFEPHCTPRRPRRSTELERRSEWAHETFALLTRYKPLLDLLDDCAKLAKSDPPILILGESGTGKELVASGMHRLSGRSGPFMAINSGSLPREIIESELFGHVAGAFTGATKDKAGMFEVCDQGTVFLDEIAEMAPELQSRLLRFLETGESRRVGSNKNISVDTRILAATNRERAGLERGEGFRVDLYYRLAHAVIALPPLRRRGDDLAILIPHFLEEACRSTRKRVRLSKEATARLVSHSWPGNVRQLKSVIKRAVILASDGQELRPQSFELDGAHVTGTLLDELEQAEKRRVVEALAQARGSRTEAAKALRIPRTTLLNKIKRYGLT